jgi:chemotaxis protein CheD
MNAMTAINDAPRRATEAIRVTVLQGEVRVSTDFRAELGTVLGSCVAACLFDPIAGVGGMNHFLLAEPPSSRSSEAVDVHYGVYLMEMLINEMLVWGALKTRIKAHLYGGANLRTGMQAIGTANADFARSFLERERISLMRSDLGGTCARRVDFRPALGQVRCRTVDAQLAPQEQPVARPQVASGDVELF